VFLSTSLITWRRHGDTSSNVLTEIGSGHTHTAVSLYLTKSPAVHRVSHTSSKTEASSGKNTEGERVRRGGTGGHGETFSKEMSGDGVRGEHIGDSLYPLITWGVHGVTSSKEMTGDGLRDARTGDNIYLPNHLEDTRSRILKRDVRDRLRGARTGDNIYPPNHLGCTRSHILKRDDRRWAQGCTHW
jgi:hypothetical protein